MKLRVIDLETTGLVATEGAEVCEIGWCDLDDGVVGAPDFRLINPGIPIPPEASAIHHIVDEDVEDAPAFNPTIRRVVSNPAIDAFVAHSAKFEQQWINAPKPWVCTLKCAYTLWPDAPTHGNMALRYWLKPEGLDRTIADAAHRAGPDAYVTAFLVREMLKLRPLAELIEISSKPALTPKCWLGKFHGKPWREVDDGFLVWILSKDFGEDVVFTVKHEIERRKNG